MPRGRLLPSLLPLQPSLHRAAPFPFSSVTYYAHTLLCCPIGALLRCWMRCTRATSRASSTTRASPT